MNLQALRLVAVVAVLAAICVYQCIDWISPPPIQIIAQLRPPRFPSSEGSDVYQVSFDLDNKYKLTCIDVVSLSELKTNKAAAPLWRLVTSSNSIPEKGFLYGMKIPGMHPPSAGFKTQPLLPDQDYRLRVEAGRFKGHIDFQTHPLTGM